MSNKPDNPMTIFKDEEIESICGLLYVLLSDADFSANMTPTVRKYSTSFYDKCFISCNGRIPKLTPPAEDGRKTPEPPKGDL